MKGTNASIKFGGNRFLVGYTSQILVNSDSKLQLLQSRDTDKDIPLYNYYYVVRNKKIKLHTILSINHFNYAKVL